MTEDQKTKIISLAKNLLGKPYKYGAKPEEAPEFFDCSSFTQYVFASAGIELPRSTILQAEYGTPIAKENLEPGDLLFFHGVQGFYNRKFPEGIGHVVLYIGNGKTIHAASERTQENPVIVESGSVEERDFSYVEERLKPLVVIKRF